MPEHPQNDGHLYPHHLDLLIQNNENPPFSFDTKRTEKLSKYLKRGKRGLDQLSEDQETLKDITGLDGLIIIDADDWETIQKCAMKDYPEFSKTESTQLAIMDWLAKDHPDFVQLYREAYMSNADPVIIGENSFDAALFNLSSLLLRQTLSKDSDAAANALAIHDHFTPSQGDTKLSVIFLPHTRKHQEIWDYGMIHEIEHAIGQNNLNDYFYDLFKPLSDDYDWMVKHCKEIESDAIVFTNFAEDINLEEVNKVSAELMHNFLLKQMQRISNHKENNGTAPLPVENVDEHETTVFIRELQSTGELPNYFQTLKDMHEFYEATYDLYAKQYKAVFGQEASIVDKDWFGKDLNLDIPENVLMDLVRQGMNAEPSVYSPGAMAIAQHYLDCMTLLEHTPESSQIYIQEKFENAQKHQKPVSPKHDTIPKHD